MMIMWVVLGAILGLVVGIWGTKRWYYPRQMQYIEKLQIYADTYRVAVYHPFTNYVIYTFSFNGGIWHYQLQLDLEGNIVECKRVTLSADEALRVRLNQIT